MKRRDGLESDTGGTSWSKSTGGVSVGSTEKYISMCVCMHEATADRKIEDPRVCVCACVCAGIGEGMCVQSCTLISVTLMTRCQKLMRKRIQG